MCCSFYLIFCFIFIIWFFRSIIWVLIKSTSSQTFLFKDILNFVGCLMSKTSFKKNSSSNIESVARFFSSGAFFLVGGTHFSRPCCVRHGWVGCASSLDKTLASGGHPPQALTLLGGVRFIAWCLKRTEKGNADGTRCIFGTAGRAWAPVQPPDPP